MCRFYSPPCPLTVLQCQDVLSEQRNLVIQFHLECVYTCLTYYEYQPAKEHIKKAQELSGLNINMTGKEKHKTHAEQETSLYASARLIRC